MKEYKIVAHKMNYEASFFQAFCSYAVNEERKVFLDSAGNGKYSMAGISPIAEITAKNNTVTIKENDKETQVIQTEDTLGFIERYLERYKCPQNAAHPPFQAGVMGFVSYDYVRKIEVLPTQADDDLNFNDIHFLVFNEVFVYDEKEKELWCFLRICEEDAHCSPQQRLEAFVSAKEISFESMNAMWQQKYPHTRNARKYSMDENEFQQCVRKIKDYILAGDVFQVNLAVRQEEEVVVHPLALYNALRTINPSPYMSFIQLGEMFIVSGSPELLVAVEGDDISTRPIAGTRSRGKSKAEDEALVEELLGSRKERAEHIMLVDLERNDLGKLCTYGSVEVDELMVVEYYSHVMHLVSNVRGKCASDASLKNVLHAMFPGGTITGAPKVRTMEIIEELEPVRRGIYTGAIGWYDFSGAMCWNIVIRTMLIQNGIGYVESGAGVVIDSVPEYEFKESLKKSRAIWYAKQVAEELYQ